MGLSVWLDDWNANTNENVEVRILNCDGLMFFVNRCSLGSDTDGIKCAFVVVDDSEDFPRVSSRTIYLVDMY